jgi:hypothetical protein
MNQRENESKDTGIIVGPIRRGLKPVSLSHPPRRGWPKIVAEIGRAMWYGREYEEVFAI